jgi:hypothetical protein
MGFSFAFLMCVDGLAADAEDIADPLTVGRPEREAGAGPDRAGVVVVEVEHERQDRDVAELEAPRAEIRAGVEVDGAAVGLEAQPPEDVTGPDRAPPTSPSGAEELHRDDGLQLIVHAHHN